MDNGASEGAPLDNHGEMPGVRVERSAGNVGFGAGCNVGADPATGDVLVVMNADVVLSRDAIARLLADLDRDPRTVVVGPRILSEGTVQPSARAFPSVRTEC